MNKRGLSYTIATFLLIVIVLVALVLIWMFVRPVIEDREADFDTSKFTTELEIISQSVIINEEEDKVLFSIKRKAGKGPVSGVNVILKDINSGEVLIPINLMIRELETKTITVSSSDLDQITSISIAPIFNIKGEEVIGNIVDTYEVSGEEEGKIPQGFCGDGVFDPDSEECEIGDTMACTTGEGEEGSQECNSECTGYDTCIADDIPQGFCGDGEVNGNDECDDGNSNNNDACTNSCTLAICGDGILNIGIEACDDGNVIGGDGCSASCSVELNWVCSLGDPSNCFADTQGEADCSLDYFGLTPLTDFLPGETYFGIEGGLYPGNNNEPPVDHKEDAIDIANTVVPLDSDGQIDVNNGKIVLMSVGMSNTKQKFEAFLLKVNADPEINDKLVVVNGAQGGSDLAKHLNVGGGGYTTTWDGYFLQLANAGVTAEQVQVVWLEQAYAGPEVDFAGFTEHTDSLDQDLGTLITVELLEKRYPNLKMIFVSGRARGYVLSDQSGLNPEFWAYQNSFGVKKLVERQINGDAGLNYDSANGPVNSPILLWGPYLWIDGVGPDGPGGNIPGRADGMEWLCSDTEGDGTHPSDTGEDKVSTQLIDFFKSQETTSPWFID